MRELTVDMVLAKAKSQTASSITAVTLASLALSEVGCLAVFVSLRQVSLVDNCVSRLQVFQYLPRLEALYLRKNQVADLAEVRLLGQCRSLTTLSLCGNPLWQRGATRADVLAAVPGLLTLDGTAVGSAEVMAAQARQQAILMPAELIVANDTTPGDRLSVQEMAPTDGRSMIGGKPQGRVLGLAGINLLQGAAIDESRLLTGHNWKPHGRKYHSYKPDEPKERGDTNNKWMVRQRPELPQLRLTAAKKTLPFAPRAAPIEQ